MATSKASNVFLVWGEGGWIAQHMLKLLQKRGATVHGTSARMEDRQAVCKVLEQLKPTRVLNCAGKTGPSGGRPGPRTIDDCEDHKEETIRSNVIGTLNLADCCWQRGIHMTNFATGCKLPGIYQYDDEHVIGGKGYTELDEPNFAGSYYSATKAQTEKLLSAYDNVLTLRFRMPTSDDLHPRSFVTKISQYEHVVDIPNSCTVLHDLLPAAIALAEADDRGVYNFTNEGAISHVEVLTMFRDIVRPNFSWKTFSLQDQSKILKAGRSNCTLDNTKLRTRLAKLGIEIPDVHTAYKQCFERMAGAGVS